MEGSSEEYLCHLKKGESINVNIDKEYAQPKYRLSKTGKKSYRAEINLLFSDIWDGNKKITNYNSVWRHKVKKCLSIYNKYLKGPDGESLKIVLSKKAPQHIISIQDEKLRPTSTLYSEGMTCPLILHEILHLLGLVDEYEETQLGFRMDKATGDLKYVTEDSEIKIYDCRALGPEDSIMNNETLAVDSFFKKKKSVRAKGSLLQPAEFRAITNPFCKTKNLKYNECIKFAYDTSLAHEEKKCEPAAIECQKNHDWLK
jgi:hypothetical protein